MTTREPLAAQPLAARARCAKCTTASHTEIVRCRFASTPPDSEWGSSHGFRHFRDECLNAKPGLVCVCSSRDVGVFPARAAQGDEQLAVGRSLVRRGEVIVRDMIGECCQREVPSDADGAGTKSKRRGGSQVSIIPLALPSSWCWRRAISVPSASRRELQKLLKRTGVVRPCTESTRLPSQVRAARRVRMLASTFRPYQELRDNAIKSSKYADDPEQATSAKEWYERMIKLEERAPPLTSSRCKHPASFG
jgi:hypothetical protein